MHRPSILDAPELADVDAFLGCRLSPLQRHLLPAAPTNSLDDVYYYIWERLKLEGTSMEEVRGAGFAGSSPLFLG